MGPITGSEKRCRHDLLACVRCGHGGAIPGHMLGLNRFYPKLDEPRYGREWVTPLAARPERRRAGRYPTHLRRAKARAQWEGHPLGVPTSHGRIVRPERKRTERAQRLADQRAAERAARPVRSTRAQRLADLRADIPGATRADLRNHDRAVRRLTR